MVEEDVKDFRLKYCNYCQWEIPREIIENISRNEVQSLFCQECGTDLMKENQDFFKYTWKKEIENVNNKATEKVIPRIATNNKEIKDIKSQGEDTAEYIYNDQDFPFIFKKNLVIVLSRMIYLDIEDIKAISNVKKLRKKTLESLVNEIIIDLSPVTEDRIKHEFLNNLIKMSKEEFEFWLRKLQSKMQADQGYYVRFIEFMRDLIKDVAHLVFKKWEESALSGYDKTIKKDLKNFDLHCFDKNQERAQNLDQVKKKPLIGSTSTITRKFALIPKITQESKGKSKKQVYWDTHKYFIKIRALKNEYVRLIYDFLEEKNDTLEYFENSDVMSSQKLYYHLEANLIKSPAYAIIPELKRKTKQCAFFEAFNVVRNSLIKSENLKIIGSELQKLFKQNSKILVDFLGGKRLDTRALAVLKKKLSMNLFGKRQKISIDYLNNHIGYLRNLLLDRTDITFGQYKSSSSLTSLQSSVGKRFNSLTPNNSLVREFLNEVIRDFTKKKNKKTVKVDPIELPELFLKRYFMGFSRKLNKRTSNNRKKENWNILKTRKQMVLNKAKNMTLSDINEMFLLAYKKEYNNFTSEPNQYILKKIFKPSFVRIQIGKPDFEGFFDYFHAKMIYKIREKIYRLFITPEIKNKLIKELSILIENINFLQKTPKFKTLSLRIIDPNVFSADYENLEFSLKFSDIRRKGSDPFNFIIRDDLKRLKELSDAGFNPKNPTLLFKNRKILLNLPLELKREAVSNQPHHYVSEKRDNIVIGVDLGLKHFAVVSVWDTSISREIARYFIDQKKLIDLKFDFSVGKFVPRDRFSNRHSSNHSNFKLHMVNLRREIRNIQRRKSEYEQRLLNRGITDFRSKFKWNLLRKQLILHWDKYSRLNLEIVHMVNNAITSIANYHGASVVKVEDLSWSKHSKKRDAGKFLANWQVSWFFSQVQEAVNTSCKINDIGFEKVNARYTSQKCSRCGVIGSRGGKSFTCECGFSLDSDLNAARNVALA